MTSRAHVLTELLTGNVSSKVISPGRVVVLSAAKHRAHAAVILKVCSL